METETGFDKERAKAFMGTMVGMLNGGSLAMMCSIGHRTGLFDRMAGLGPSTRSGTCASGWLRWPREG